MLGRLPRHLARRADLRGNQSGRPPARRARARGHLRGARRTAPLGGPPRPRRQRPVLHLRFVDDLTQGEIGERIGVSQMQVSRILRGILGRLRADLAGDDVAQAAVSAA